MNKGRSERTCIKAKNILWISIETMDTPGYAQISADIHENPLHGFARIFMEIHDYPWLKDKQ
jgi:hypothetical protein